MKPSPANRNSKDILRALMDPSQPDIVPWSSSELRAILEHQLTTPLASEVERLAQLAGCSQQRAAELVAGSTCQTFGDLLQQEHPSPALLRMVKDFAKASLSEHDELPKDVARVLYVLAILRGRLCGTRLTALDASNIERESRRCLVFGWLPEHLRDSIRAALRSDREG